MKTRLFILLQHILPQHGLSRLIGKLADLKLSPGVRNKLLPAFIRKFKIDMSICTDPDINSYPTFNSFFIRTLKPEARPIAPGKALISPVDGTVSQCGTIVRDRLLQAKARYYTLAQLLANDPSVSIFNDGLFATIYLAPRDYHRVHMPYTGKLLRSIYVPGKLFSVNPTTAENVDSVFARNERLIAIFETEFGLMAVIFVGAMLVAGICTAWQGIVAPNQVRDVQIWQHEHDDLIFKKGDELGYFNFGSTIILLLPKKTLHWLPDLVAEKSVTLGSEIAR
ncbi:MAG: phosphatidylserine decarboxylase [Gammaproteobacteria bacterium]|nr:phosphatidylserine decarboxylase [Gammaproteobacteria bacterium]